MVFSSHTFIFYFLPAFLFIYLLVSNRFKNGIALFFSLLFYSWGAPLFVFVLTLFSWFDFIITKKFSDSSNKKTLLITGLLLNVNSLLHFPKIPNPEIVLPVGISFFTFQKISYLVDMYRGTSRPQKRFSDYLLFVCLFPQLIAGPIVRYQDVSEQLYVRKETADTRFQGLFRFIIGLAKKVLIANVLAEQLSQLLASDQLSLLGTGLMWFVMFIYALQIYFDFSGYSDMAIGLGLLMGFKFPENFNFPYIAKNITEFWKRWHITLGQWMKDYLYIPLGGNRSSTIKTYRNLVLVFLLSGLWHGASWNFLLWGAFHGFFLILDRMFLIKWSSKLPSILSVFFTFIVILMSWVLFKFSSLSEVGIVYKQLFSYTPMSITTDVSNKFITVFVIGTSFAFMGLYKPLNDWLQSFFKSSEKLGRIYFKASAALFLLYLCISELTVSGFNPFIYFRF